MEYLSLLLADRMIKCQVIEEDDKKYYAYSIQLLLEKITGILLISGFALIFKSFAEIILFLITLLSDPNTFRWYTLQNQYWLPYFICIGISFYNPGFIGINEVTCNMSGRGDIINDLYILHWYNQKPQFGPVGAGTQSP